MTRIIHRAYLTVSPPQRQNHFIGFVAEVLEIHPDQLRGIATQTTPLGIVEVTGCYRKEGIYYNFAINLETEEITRNEVC